MEEKNMFKKELKSDLPASIVVFFVAVPLCLGIALTYSAPFIFRYYCGHCPGGYCGRNNRWFSTWC